jgi:hypothetical protein
MKADKTTRGWVVSNHKRRKNKKVESNIDSVAHNQALKQQKQVKDRNCHMSININTEYKWTELPQHKIPFGKLD